MRAHTCTFAPLLLYCSTRCSAACEDRAATASTPASAVRFRALPADRPRTRMQVGGRRAPLGTRPPHARNRKPASKAGNIGGASNSAEHYTKPLPKRHGRIGHRRFSGQTRRPSLPSPTPYCSRRAVYRLHRPRMRRLTSSSDLALRDRRDGAHACQCRRRGLQATRLGGAQLGCTASHALRTCLGVGWLGLGVRGRVRVRVGIGVGVGVGAWLG